MNPMVDSLRAVPLFADLGPKDLKRLADTMTERTSRRASRWSPRARAASASS